MTQPSTEFHTLLDYLDDASEYSMEKQRDFFLYASNVFTDFETSKKLLNQNYNGDKTFLAYNANYRTDSEAEEV